MPRNGVGARPPREMSADILRAPGGGGGSRKAVGRVYPAHGDGEGTPSPARCELCAPPQNLVLTLGSPSMHQHI